MPKALSELERQRIRQSLFSAAGSSMKRYGFKKTTVDQLVKIVGIPKGTFYLFFESKEQLFYEIFRNEHDRLQNMFLDNFNKQKNYPLQPEIIAEMIYSTCKDFDQSFLFDFVISGDIELVMRKLPDTYLKEHIGQDDLSFEKLIDLIPGMDLTKIRGFSGALRLAMVSMMHKKDIGEDIYDTALKITIKGIVNQMFEEQGND